MDRTHAASSATAEAEARLDDFGVAVASGDTERIAGLFDEDGHIFET
jgi:hypothetical protein